MTNPRFQVKTKDGLFHSWNIMGHFPDDDVYNYVFSISKNGINLENGKVINRKDIDYVELVNV